MGVYKDRQLQIQFFEDEGSLQKAGTECQGYAEASSTQGMTPAKSANIANSCDLMEKIVSKGNLRKAYAKVKSNKGSAGVDRMSVNEMHDYFKNNVNELIHQVQKGSYIPRVTRKTKRNAAKVNATLRFILQILFKTVAVTFARRRF